MHYTASKYTFVFGCCCLLNSRVYAKGNAQPTQVSPPTSQTHVDVFADDARLLQKVAAHCEGVPLDELLARLSAECGVTLKAQQDIADEKVIVLSKSRPLRDLLYDVSSLLNDTWTRQEQSGSKPLYRLVRNGRAREFENAQLDKMNNRLKARLEEQARALAETPEERKRRPANDPIRERLSNPRGHLGTRFYALLDAAQRQSLFAHEYFDVPYTLMTPAQQEALRNAFVEMNADFDLVDEKGVKQSALPKDLEHSSLRFSVYSQGGRESAGFGFNPPGYGLDGVTIAQIDNRAEWLLPLHGNPYTGAPVSAKAALPSANAVRSSALEIPAAKKTWLDRLNALAEQTGVTICGDFYRSKAAHPVKAEEDPPARVSAASPSNENVIELDNLCRPVGYMWWMQGKTLLLRKRDWFAQRPYEAPDRWILETAKRLEAQKGVPTYGDAMRLLDLSGEQIAGLMSFNDTPHGEWYGDLGVMKRTVLGSRELLEIWNAFPNSRAGIMPGYNPFKDAQTYSKEFQQSTRSFGDFTALQRGLTQSFVNGDYVFGMGVPRRKHPVTEDEMATFHTRIGGPAPSLQDSDAKPVPERFRSVPIELAWWLDGGEGANRCVLFLPSALPQDRRDKTKIEIVP